MAINFSAQFIVNEKTSTRVLRLTDTSTGFTLSKGNFIVTFPDGSVVSNTDFSSPEITAPGGNTSISLITDVDNTVLTGTYIINYVALNTSLNEFTKTETFDFNWEKPVKAIINDSDVVLPEVQFKDLTAYETSGSFSGVLTRNFFTTTPSTSEVGVITKTSAGDILTPVNASKYYEGIYLVRSDISVLYTHTSKSWLTVSYVDLLQETYDVREAPTQDELVALINTYKNQIEEYKTTNPSQYEILNEQYDLVLALYSHILARYQTNTLDGSKAILDQLLGLLPPASSYTYKATQMLPFTINFSTSLTGTGTTGTVPKFTGTTTLGDSIIKEDTNRIGIGKTPTTTLDVNGAIQGTSIVKAGGTSAQFLKADGSIDASTYLTTGSAASSYQPLDGDLSAIAVLAGAAGILTKVSANTWTLDTTSYQVLDADLTAIAALAGTSGILIKTAANTWSLDTTSYQVLDADLTAIAALTGNSGILIKTAANTWALDTATYQLADADLTAIAALAGTSGLIRKTAANTYELDTSVYLTGITSGQITTALGFTPENAANKGVNNGYASLDGAGKVPSTQLPSYVDDVLEAANVAALPATGETGKIYITLDTNKIYRWTGSVYVEISPSVGTVWGGITGTLSNQTDLQNALNAKFNNPTGLASQYIRGDGTLSVLPTGGGGGGGGVSYYLNGSINQGTIGGVTYYEMNKVPIIGTGTDFSRNSNGYIASFLTDANDPALLNIPAGNWNFETYLQASSGGGSPSFYIELYKYDGTTFTLIASNSGTPKLINDGTSIEAYFSALVVPQTTLTLTDRLAIRIYVNTSGRTITLHTENGHLCQVVTTFSSGLSALNGLTEQVQYFATGTSGTDFNISSSAATHTFNLPTASATNRGALSSADWITFNGKANLANPVFTDNIYISGTNPRLYFTDTDTNPDYTIFVDSGVFYILNQTVGEARLSIAETGNISAGVGKSMVATSFIKRGGTSSEFLMADGSVTAGAVVNYPGIGIAVSGGGGWLTSIDDNSANWNAAYSARISSLTTTGNSGAATLASNVLNIPNYTIAGLGGQPAFASGTGFVKISGTTISYVNETYYLASNPSGYTTNTGTVTSVSGTGTVSGLTLTGTVTSSGSLTLGGTIALASGDVTTALGFMPVSPSSLSNYLPLTGGSLANTLSSGYVLSVTNNGTAADSNGLYVNIDTASTGTPFKVARGGVSLINVNYLGATVLKSTITAISFIKSSGTSSEYLMADGSVSTGMSFTYPGAGIVVSTGTAWGTSITDNSSNWNTAYSSRITSATAPLNITGTTISISQAGASANGFLSSTDWNTFNNKASTASLANYLPLAGGTLTGALTLTNSNVNISNAYYLTARNNANTAYLGLIGRNTSDKVVIDPDGYGLTVGGAATFSSSVTATSATLSQNSNSIIDVLTLYNVSATSAGVRQRFQNGFGDLAAISVSQRDNGALADDGQMQFQIASNSALDTKMTILNNGNVGIGTTSPSGAAGLALAINGGSSQTRIALKNSFTGDGAGNGFQMLLDAGSADVALELRETGSMRFATSSSERMRITSGGNVGIGTTAPQRLLDARGAVNLGNTAASVASTSGAYADIHLRTWSGATSSPSRITVVDNWIDYFATFSDGHRFRNWSADGVVRDLMTITGTGNVGIGTTAPLSILHTLVGSSTNNYFYQETTTSNVWSGNLLRYNGTDYMGSIGNISTGEYKIGGFNNTGYFVTLYTNNSERMRITSGGNVLIGKTSDNGYKLQVLGSISATSFFETSDLRLKNITKKYDSEEFGAIEFGWIDGRDSKNHWGYVAQEVEKYLPDAIHLGNDGFLAVDYNQAHTFKIAKVEDEVTLLKRRVAELEAQLNSL
jgi:hypothetical protein